MAKVDTNTVALNYAREAVAGTKPSEGWRSLEPNEITDFGATISTTPREPISDRLQRRKGSVTDLDASVAFSADITVDGLWDWLEAAIFAKSVNADVRSIPVTAVEAADDSYTVASLEAAAADKLEAGTLIWAYGFGTLGNDGLKRVDADIAADNAAVKVTVAEGLVDAPAAQSGFISLAGVRIEGKAGAGWAWDASEKTATLTWAAHGLGNARGLYVGQTVHFGSVDSALDQDLKRGIAAARANVGLTGFARVKTITDDTIVFDRVGDALQGPDPANDHNVPLATTTNAGPQIDIIFGDFVRNVPRGDPAYVQQPHTIELLSPDLFDTDAAGAAVDEPLDGHEYAVGHVIGTLVLNFPLTDKATMTATFIGEDVEKPSRMRQAGAQAAATPVLAEAINTSADFARIGITKVDESGLTTDLKSVTITINAQASPEKVLGKLGARFINRGNLLVDVEAQAIFSSEGVINAIRDNETLHFDVIFGNSEGVFVIEVPSQTLGGGGREYPANQAVLINTTGQAFEDADFATSIHVSFMPVPIPTD